MEAFVPAIIALRNCKPDELIAGLHRMFQTITALDADGVVAAYQTVKTTAEAMNLQQDRMIQTLLNALVAQMHAIVNTPSGRRNEKRFKSVTGHEFGLLGMFG